MAIFYSRSVFYAPTLNLKPKKKSKRKKKRKLGIHTFPNNTKALLDDIFINKKSINSPVNCEA